MRISEVRELDDTELGKELGDQERGLMNLRFRKATLQLSNTNELKNTRRTIARIKTVIRERVITAGLEVGGTASDKPVAATENNSESAPEPDSKPENEGE
ncbi:50S ribosomal protein L29 [Dehalococcoides mccartyi]|nr:50S ribosomal protein L29 [Dehalococcoides mccartyi]